MSAALKAVKAFVTPYLGPLGWFLTFGITLPVWLFIVAGGWLWFDRTSAVRQAVNSAVTELVAGAELASMEAQLVEERRLRAFEQGRADALEAANQRFETARITSELESERLAHDLAELQARPVPDQCDVTPDLLDRLR